MDINRITVEFKFIRKIMCIYWNININRITVEFKSYTAE